MTRVRRQRRLRRLTMFGGLAAGFWAWRQRNVEANRQRYNLP